MRRRDALFVAVAVAAAALFVSLAATRRLNFDEALALRAGWLEIAGEPSSPAFLMPWTLLVGAAGHLIPDPGVALAVLRIATASAVAIAFLGAARAAGLSLPAIAGASWLLLANAAFATHGLEFRYDAAILILLLVALRTLERFGSERLLGLIAGVLALHHLKGAFFAMGLGALVLVISPQRLRSAGRFASGIALAWGGWLALLVVLGLGGRFAASLGSFYELASSSARAGLGETMGPVLLRDLAWWGFILCALGRGILMRRSDDGAPRGTTGIAALAIGGLGIVFWLVHPHAWAYLAALPAPFLTLAAAKRLSGGVQDLALPAGVALLCGALQLLGGTPPPPAHIARALRAPMAPEVELLRSIRAAAGKEDRILDPSGIVYFVRPCVGDWYVDALYAERVRRGEWMRELASGIPRSCTLALDTYRLGALPPAARAELGREFRLVGAGLAVRRSRTGAPIGVADARQERVENYW